jgi:hypothetical protein
VLRRPVFSGVPQQASAKVPRVRAPFFSFVRVERPPSTLLGRGDADTIFCPFLTSIYLKYGKKNADAATTSPLVEMDVPSGDAS